MDAPAPDAVPGTSEDSDAAKRREFFVTKPLKLASEVQARLPMDEVNYLHVAGHAHQDARAYFLYGALDEVVKASVAAIRWRDLLAGPEDEQRPTDDVRTRMGRMILESTASDQAMWRRKLTEVLLDVVLFQGTNEQDYYASYMALKSLAASEEQQGDTKEFFSCQIANLDTAIQYERKFLSKIAPHLDIARAWFLKSPSAIGPSTTGNRRLSSARSRYMKAQISASPETRWLLGASYVPSYGQPSDHMHWSIGAFRRKTTLADVDRTIQHIGLLGFRIGLMAQELAGIEPTDLSRAVSASLSSDESKSRFAEHFQREFETGDVVIVDREYVCQIVSRSQSKYGNTSYLCRFLGRPPLQEIPEDWMPSPGIELVFPRRKLVSGLSDLLRASGAPAAEVAAAASLSVERATDLLAKVFVSLDRDGVLRFVAGRGWGPAKP